MRDQRSYISDPFGKCAVPGDGVWLRTYPLYVIIWRGVGWGVDDTADKRIHTATLVRGNSQAALNASYKYNPYPRDTRDFLSLSLST